ncbi:MAG: gliding motility-associated C-terminal domain-containing protein, partial [Crocinitomicaceae bacterium]
VFSPNGDGIDDTWKIKGIENFPDANVDVLDRWGQKVFQTVGYSSLKWWDGTSPSGKPLATSTYYYVINLNDANKTVQKGPITIMR